MSLHFKNICRVCLKNGEGCSINDSNLAEKYYFTTQLNVTQNDGLPETICDKCFAKMKVAYEFRRLAVTSHKQLVAFITKMTGEFKKVSKSLPNETLTELDVDELKVLMDEGFDPTSGKHYVNHFNAEEIIDFDQSMQKSDVEYLNEDLFDNLKTYETENYDEEPNDNSDPFFDIKIEIPKESTKSAKITNCKLVTKNSPNSSKYQLLNARQVQNRIEEINDLTQMTTRKKLQRKKELSVSISQDSEDEIGSKMDKRSYRKRKKNDKDGSFEFTRFACKKCKIDFSSKQNLNRHLSTHDGSKPFQCSDCGKAFTQNGSLKKHILIHTGERPHKCDICKLGFTQSTTLLRHMRRHTGEKPYECTLCDKKFRQKHMLKAHCDKIHHVETVFNQHACPICNRSFSSKFSADEHMKKHRENNSDNFKCHHCEKVFSSKISLDIHNETYHTGYETVLKCEICEECFSTNALLVAHIQDNHSPTINKLHCVICSKEFVIRSQYIQHIRSHTESSSNLFSCNDCSIAFSSEQDLNFHRNKEHCESMQDLKDCDQCKLKFYSVDELNEHNFNSHADEEICSGSSNKQSPIKIMENHVFLEQILDSVL